jgi:hypothetical protein
MASHTPTEKTKKTMSLRQISSRIELSFWQIIISLLSESRHLQRLVRWVYLEFLPVLEIFFENFDKKRAFLWAAGGVGFGLLTGLLISLL